MSVIGSTSIFGTASNGATGSTTSGSATGSELTQADFLKLMTAQLQAQDPTSPMDNSQFASQLAQFSQLSATQDVDTNLQALSSSLSSSMQASQVLSSASLVGRQVMVPSSSATYSSGAVSGGVNVTNAGDVQVQILDDSGNLVRSIDLGTQQPGLAQFSWDGTDNSGKPVAPGQYTLSANNAGSKTALSTYVSATVTGVGYGGTTVGTYLQVAGIGGVPLSQVAQIN